MATLSRPFHFLEPSDKCVIIYLFNIVHGTDLGRIRVFQLNVFGLVVHAVILLWWLSFLLYLLVLIMTVTSTFRYYFLKSVMRKCVRSTCISFYNTYLSIFLPNYVKPKSEVCNKIHNAFCVTRHIYVLILCFLLFIYTVNNLQSINQ